jgi:hypothetical protein
MFSSSFITVITTDNSLITGSKITRIPAGGQAVGQRVA